jgi:glucokinase
LPFFEKSAFAARLSEYGIFTDYIAAVPVWLITIEEPGLTGAGLALSNPYLQHRTL